MNGSTKKTAVSDNDKMFVQFRKQHFEFSSADRFIREHPTVKCADITIHTLSGSQCKLVLMVPFQENW